LRSLTPITEADIDRILVIERNSFKRPWSRESLLREFAHKDACNYSVRCNNSSRDDRMLNTVDIIAYICFRIIADKMHIMKIAVAPEWRHQGIALWLLEKSLENAVKKGAEVTYLEVRPSNYPAIGLYNKTGFRIVGKQPNYYSETREDALVMIKNLKEEI
jgi:ribosomal-protein-alanine N-acetyltransferase